MEQHQRPPENAVLDLSGLSLNVNWIKSIVCKTSLNFWFPQEIGSNNYGVTGEINSASE